MRTYETAFIIDGSVSDATREAVIARFEKNLTNRGAELLRTVRWGKRQLAYPIKKQPRGYYVIYYYEADPSIINPFHRDMDINETILRYMSLVSDGIHPDYVKDEAPPSDKYAESSSAARRETVRKVVEPEVVVAAEKVEETPEVAEEVVEAAEEAVETSEEPEVVAEESENSAEAVDEAVETDQEKEAE